MHYTLDLLLPSELDKELEPLEPVLVILPMVAHEARNDRRRRRVVPSLQRPHNGSHLVRDVGVDAAHRQRLDEDSRRLLGLGGLLPLHGVRRCGLELGDHGEEAVLDVPVLVGELGDGVEGARDGGLVCLADGGGGRAGPRRVGVWVRCADVPVLLRKLRIRRARDETVAVLARDPLRRRRDGLAGRRRARLRGGRGRLDLAVAVARGSRVPATRRGGHRLRLLLLLLRGRGRCGELPRRLAGALVGVVGPAARRVLQRHPAGREGRRRRDRRRLLRLQLRRRVGLH
mmetsp:Transcript_9384/g.21856  ORF Transcript_9384/g.21856 Transcript_9384/m.21856 type:complete len:287 (+) Transcript_9384:597-1457(+)